MIQLILVYLLTESMVRALNHNGFKIELIDYPYFNTKYFNKKNLLKMLDHKKNHLTSVLWICNVFCLQKKK